MAIPEGLLENITELELHGRSDDVTKFVRIAKTLISKTRRLKFLRLSPEGKVEGFVAMIA